MAVRLVRALEAVLGDESDVHRRIDQEIRGHMVSVAVHGHPDEKMRAFEVLKAHHAREIHRWGRWTFEDAV